MVVLVLAAAPASAHVTVSSPDAAAGGFGKVVFRVPTESDTASTTKLRVTLPEDTPFAFVSTQPKPGWKVEVKKAKLDKPITSHGTTLSEAVRTVTWSTEGDGIAPGEFDEFALSLGQFPEVKTLSFAAVQTYDDGEVVAWDQPTDEGGEQPERPAPTLELAAAGDEHGRTGQEAGRRARLDHVWCGRRCRSRRCGAGVAESTSCVVVPPSSPPWSCLHRGIRAGDGARATSSSPTLLTGRGSTQPRPR